jgi:hypothetical protein
MTTPLSTFEPSEIQLLEEDIIALRLHWDSRFPALFDVARAGGRSLFLLHFLVQEYFLRTIDYADGIRHLLHEGLVLSAFPVMRSLLEVELALEFLAIRDEPQQIREAQIAAAHGLYHAQWKIGRLVPTSANNVRLAEVRQAIADASLLIPSDIMAEAKERESEYSWTGRKARDLFEDIGRKGAYDDFYAPLSTMTHGHHEIIAHSFSPATASDLERYASACRRHVGNVQVYMEIILRVKFRGNP